MDVISKVEIGDYSAPKAGRAFIVSVESRTRKLLRAAGRGYPDRVKRVLGKDTVDLGDPQTGDTALVS